MIKKSQVKFILYFIVIFIILFLILYSLGLVPESIKSDQGDSIRTLWDKAQKNAIEKQVGQGGVFSEVPIRIVIEKIKVDAAISNPNTTNVATLDEYLKQGAVRYPGSGLLGFGNMFIFGHSTGLTNVNNPAYKTFNNINNLQKGDIITVLGNSNVYKYKVTSVTLVDKNRALVEFDNTRSRLTLSTCTTFGAKDERYVVEADYLP